MPRLRVACNEVAGKNVYEKTIINHIEKSSAETKRRIINYFEQWILKSSIHLPTGNVAIITDAEGKKVVVINDLRFKRSKRVDWNTVEEYLKEYIGECAEILDTNAMIYIGSDFPVEYAHSKDTKVLRGPNEYVKANASVAIKELIQLLQIKHFRKIIRISIIVKLNMWMAHRPMESMFKKKSVIVSTAAGTGIKSAMKEVEDCLFYLGVPEIYKYGMAVQAMRRDGLMESSLGCDRLKRLGGRNYFEELLTRIRNNKNNIFNLKKMCYL